MVSPAESQENSRDYYLPETPKSSGFKKLWALIIVVFLLVAIPMSIALASKYNASALTNNGTKIASAVPISEGNNPRASVGDSSGQMPVYSAPIVKEDLGITISNISLSHGLNPGESKRSFTITSTGAEGFSLGGYPTSYGTGIDWSTPTGTLSAGQLVDISIKVGKQASDGVYQGKAVVISHPSNKKIDIGDVIIAIISPAK